MQCAECLTYSTSVGGTTYLDVDALCHHLMRCRLLANGRLVIDAGNNTALINHLSPAKRTCVITRRFTATAFPRSQHRFAHAADIVGADKKGACYKLLRLARPLPEGARKRHDRVTRNIVLVCEVPLLLGLARLRIEQLAAWCQVPPAMTSILGLELHQRAAVEEFLQEYAP